MDGLATAVGRVGGGLANLALVAVLFFAVLAAGGYAAQRTGKGWVGWVVGIVTAIALILLFSPALDALKAVSCRGVVDYQACIEGDDDSD